MKIKKLVFLPIFFLLSSNCFFPLALAKPYWLKEGFSATYKFKSYQIKTKIIEVSDHGVACEALDRGNGTYSWEVKSLSGSYAEIDVDLDLVYRVREEGGFVTLPWNKTVSVKIDVDNRDTMAPNGTNLGKINFWIDPNVEKWDNVTIYGKPPYAINATVMTYLYNPVKTPAGEFDCWHVYVKGKTRPDVGIKADLNLWYDKATGILVAADFSYYDVVLMLMGVIDMDLLVYEGVFKAPSSFVLEYLTTSPPSSPQFLNLLDYVPYIVAAAAAAAIPTAVYLTRRKRKKTHATE